MVSISTNDQIRAAVKALDPGTIFESKDITVKNCSSRKISSILKSRIRWEHNPNGDLKYENGKWMKLES